jgi:hypothetical protein
MSEADLELLGGLTITNGLTVSGGTVDFSGASSGGGIELTDLSTTTAAAGAAGLAYDNTTGVFTFTPPNLSGYALTASLAAVATSGAYADLTGKPTIPSTTDDITEGSTNLYFTNARAASGITASDLDMGGNKVLFANVYSAEGNLPSASTYHGMFAHVHGTGKGYFAHAGNWVKLLDETSSTTTNLSEGSNLYYTDARVDSRLSGGSVATITTSGNITVGGDLTVSGTTTTVDTETINLADNTITLNSNYTGSSPTEDGGIEVERGTLTNKTLVWDETNDKWSVGSEAFVAGAFEGNLIGNVTGTVSSLSNHDTNDVTEGSSNLYYTNARARAAVSVTNAAAGTAALAYNSSTGQFTFTPPDLSGLGGIALTDLSAGTVTATGGGSLSYNNATGQFLLTPPDLSGYATTSSLATVATTGAYSDLTGAPAALTDTDGLTEGSTNLYHTTARARSSVAAVTGAVASGGGNLSYNQVNGEFTFTKPDLSSYLTDITGESLSDLSNVASTTPTDGQVLTYDTTNGWQPETPSSGSSGGLGSYGSVNSTGTAASALGTDSIAIGLAASVPSTANRSIAIGDNSSALTHNSVAIGRNAKVMTNTSGTALGYNSDATGASAVALGAGSQALHNYSFAFGLSATTTAANQVMFGSTSGNGTINSIQVGNTSYTPTNAMDLTTKSYVDTNAGIALSDLSVTTASASGSGSLAYDNSTGVFTFTPAASSGGGSVNWIASNNTSAASAGANGALALGGNSTASGEALAVGNYAVASGAESVAIGSSNSSTTHLKTNATSAYAIALGHRAQAVGQSAITIGWDATAGTSTKTHAIAIGASTTNNYDKSVALGYSTTTTADRQLMLGASGTNGFTSVRVGNTSYTPSDNMDLATKAYVDSASGGGGGGTDYLAAEGTNTTAATATGTSAVAAGYEADAGGNYSVSLGYQANAGTTSAISIGYDSNAATGNQTIAIGQSTDATGTYAIAHGLLANAAHNYSAAIGYYATTGQANQLMLGRNSNTNGFTSIRVGNTSYSPSDNMDLTTKAYVDANAGLPATISMGSGSGSASSGGSNSVALGQGSNASQTATVAVGRQARAITQASIAIGDSAYARGSNSNGSIAIGYAADANGTTNPIAIGAWSDAGNYSTAVGSGYSSTVRCYAAYTSSAFGYKGYAGGNYQVAIGAFSSASNNNAHAVGYGAVANGSNANAFGNYASAYANQFVLGNSSINDLKCQDTSITGVSDSRDKTDITALTLGLDFVNAIEPKAFHKNNRSQYYTSAYDEPALDEDESLEQSYTFDQTAYDAGTQKFSKREFGFVAQEVAAQLPSEYSDARLTYSETEDKYGYDVQRFTIGDMTPILWKALRELSDKHDQLQSDYDALLARVVALENA